MNKLTSDDLISLIPKKEGEVITAKQLSKC